MADIADLADVTAVGALADPTRRALYRYVVARPVPVSRDDAAAAVGVPRHAARFHLDRLVAAGLLDVEFRRLSERRGPGAGRPSKLYRRSARQLDVTLPPREYDLAGRILAAGVEESTRTGGPVLDAVARAAAEEGRRIGGTDPGPPSDVLARHGYEPRVEGDRLVLGNCPFHALAADHTALVCGMNLHLLTALLDALGTAAGARLDPEPGRCCVVVDALGKGDVH